VAAKRLGGRDTDVNERERTYLYFGLMAGAIAVGLLFAQLADWLGGGGTVQLIIGCGAFGIAGAWFTLRFSEAAKVLQADEIRRRVAEQHTEDVRPPEPCG
jgi:hypothetical protein